MAPLLDEHGRRLWAAAEAAALGYGGDAVVSSATGLARQTIRNGRRELVAGIPIPGEFVGRARGTRTVTHSDS